MNITYTLYEKYNLEDYCYYCEREFDNRARGWTKTKDHVVPKSRGGNSQHVNLRWCCSNCNSLKGKLLPDELANILKVYQKHGIAAGVPKLVRKFSRGQISAIIDNLEHQASKIAEDKRPYLRKHFNNITPHELQNRLDVIRLVNTNAYPKSNEINFHEDAMVA